MVQANARAEVVLICDNVELAAWPLLCPLGLDLSVVDDLARLQLEVRSQGCAIWLRHACPDLVGLLQLAGLSDVLQVGGQAEGGEQGGVEEVVVPDDPVA